MFTGIIQSVGQIASLTPQGDDVRLTIIAKGLDLHDVSAGDSIAVNGVCLTVVELQHDGFAMDVSTETLSCTTLARLASNDSVNLEKALLPTTRLGGHLVSGHVDGIATVVKLHDDARSRRIYFSVPRALSRYIAVKGSVCIDGVSLTVNAVKGCEFEVNIIPHTMQHTVIGDYHRDTRVNIEVDIIARYLERLLTVTDDSSRAGALDMGFLAAHGFSGKQ